MESPPVVLVCLVYLIEPDESDNQRNQTDQMNQTSQIDHKSDAMLTFVGYEVKKVWGEEGAGMAPQRFS
jgi:hypothetical protein